jgi:hypothetical protein
VTPPSAPLRAFTQPGSGPKTTFPLVLAAVTIAVLSMSLDAVPRYSQAAFVAGLGLTLVFAIVSGKVVDAIKASTWRTASSVILPTAFGAFIGMVVQAIVLFEVGTSWHSAVRDLGGLVDTTSPVPWIASGIVLGGAPALVVSLFLVLAHRSIRRLIGHDASEGFGVAFTGFAGLLAAFGLVVVDGIAAPPLFVVALTAGIVVLVALLVDGSRIRFLRDVYAGQGAGFDIVPADRFANDPALAPMVAEAGSASVLVRIDTHGSYRAAAIEPLAFVGDTESDTLRPLRRRRAAAAAILVGMSMFVGLGVVAHA